MPKTRRLSDATLVRRSQQGDRRAFSALLGRYDWRLRGLAHALLLDQTEMEAALGIGYLRAWRDVVRINGKDDVAAWLYRVTYNACIDQLRRADGAPAAPTAGATGVAAGLATLPAAERVAVVLVDREGFSPASAARILGLTPTSLTRTLDAARERLSAYLPTPTAAPNAEPAGPPATPDTTDDAAGNGARANGHDPGEPAATAEATRYPGGEAPDRTAASANGTLTSGSESVTDPADAGADADTDADARPRSSETTGGEVGDSTTTGTQTAGSQTAQAGSDGDGDRDGDGDSDRSETHGSAITSDTGTSDTGTSDTGTGDTDTGDTDTGDMDTSRGDNGNGSNSGRGRRARRRAKHAAAHQTTDRPDPSGGDTP